MPRTWTPKTEFGEFSLVQIALRADDYLRLMRGHTQGEVTRGRHVWQGSTWLRQANAIVDFIAVAENFSLVRLLAICPALKESDVFSWQKRIAAWERHAGIKLEQLIPDWEALRGFIEVRNALQHGLGRLTEAQLDSKRHDQTLSWIEKADVPLHGDLVQIDHLTVKRSREVCAAFVGILDSAAPTP
jgi:hypothetical protein